MTDSPADGIRARAFFCADHAALADGKLYVNGGFWDRLNFPVYPQVLASMTVVAVLEVPFRDYHRDHDFALLMEDADRRLLPLRVEAQFRVGSDPQMRYGDPTILSIPIPVNSLVFERPGDYAFVLHVDGKEIDRCRFRAVQVPAVMHLPPSGSSTDTSAEGESPDET